MTVLRAHFDGRVFVPDEPVDLPQGRTFELQLREIEDAIVEAPELPFEKHPLTGFPIFKVPPGAKMVNFENFSCCE